MNFIFDIGNVLVDFKPVIFLRSLFTDNTLIEKINDIVFKSPEWLKMDHGLLSRDEATEIFCSRFPEYTPSIHRTMQGINYIFTPIAKSIELLPKIKDSGHGLYYLSNMQIEIRDYLLENHKYFKLFDGGVFSCDIHKIKPAPEIYRHLINEYRLDPAESIFFDDMPENIAAAEKEGIKGILFTTVQCVKPYI